MSGQGFWPESQRPLNWRFPTEPVGRWQVFGQTLFSISESMISSNKKEHEETHAILTAILESSNDAIIGSTPGGKIIRWNKKAEEIYGYTVGEVANKNISMLMPPDRSGDVFGLLKKLQKGESVEHVEIVQVTKAGKTIHIDLTIMPIKAGGGKLVGASAIARDITDLKRAEKELKKYAEELQRSKHDLEQFAYISSHDLQVPLRMITSYMQLLHRRYKNRLDTEAEEYIDFAVKGAIRMKRLIDALLAYSRVNQRCKAFERIESSLPLRRALSNLEEKIKETGAVVTFAELPQVKADSMQLMQLFHHLVDNALNYRNQQDPIIHIAAERLAREWIFSVRDNGVGIEAKYAQRIFWIFQRLQHDKNGSSTGIGLPLCKKIVERHGGRIWFESTPGKGTIFYFSIPEKETEVMNPDDETNPNAAKPQVQNEN